MKHIEVYCKINFYNDFYPGICAVTKIKGFWRVVRTKDTNC